MNKRSLNSDADLDFHLLTGFSGMCFVVVGESSELVSGEDALARIRRLIAEGGMTAVVQREQSTTMASMGGFGNNIIVSHRIHRGSQTATGQAPSSSSGHASSSNHAQSTSSSPPPTSSTGPLPFSQTDQSLTLWGPQSSLSLEDVFDGARTDEDSLPGPSSSSLLLSSPSSSSSNSSSSSHSPLPSSSPHSYHGDPYSR